VTFEELICDLAAFGIKKWDLSLQNDKKSVETPKGTIETPREKDKLQPDSKACSKRLVKSSQKTDTPFLVAKQARYIPAPLRRLIWQRDQGHCQYKGHQSGIKCGAKFNLHIDHIKPFALDGGHTKDNLRLLCAAHNGYRAAQTFGHRLL
jgi:hypothetical protein